MPIVTLPRLLLSLVSWAILAAAIYLLWRWNEGALVPIAQGVYQHVHGPDWMLASGGGLLAWSLVGRFPVLMLMPEGADGPKELRRQGATVMAPDGSALFVETSGKSDGPTVVLTHGWGLNATAWWYTRRALEGHFRVITWDLPGLGRSRGPSDGRYTMDRFGEALGAVVEASAANKVLLIGHSIGGMTTQTFWRACEPSLRVRIAGMALIDTTYQNPLRTMWLSRLWLALRWPLIEPLSRLTVALWPLAWLSAWLGYLNGSNQLVMRLTGFGDAATRGQVDFVARLAAKGSPAVQAKGNLAMFHWDATEAVRSIKVPILVLVGGADIVTLPSASEFIEATAPGSTLCCIAGGGHLGFMEKSNAYNTALIAFADRILTKPTS